MKNLLRVLGVCALVPVVILGLVSAAWAVDRARLSGKVTRNVSVAGIDIGEKTVDEATKVIDDVASSFPATKVDITTAGTVLHTTAGELGLSVDAKATTTEALALGHEGYSPRMAINWAQRLSTPQSLPVKMRVDKAELTKNLAAIEGTSRVEPVEPSVTLGPNGATLVPGVEGRMIDANDVIAHLPKTLDDLNTPISITAKQLVITPKHPDKPFEAIKAKIDDLVTNEVALTAADDEETLEWEDMVKFLKLENGADGLPVLKGDAKVATDVAKALFPTTSNPTRVTFSNTGAAWVPVAGHDAQVCCDAKAGQALIDNLVAGKHEIDLPTTTMTAAEAVEWAKGLGIKEAIGSFTTNHPCCANRVTNIHKISDMARGALIPPGGTFSVNDYIGRRTVEKGFVEDGVIEDGEFKKDVGGGVSQFATTLFNAAFFAGLEIPDHKAHSVYISRYPFGREATLAYPNVDLKIHNNSPYGVVIDTGYTDTSVTITLYSTKWAVGEQVGSAKASQTSAQVPEGCGEVTVTRKVTIIATGASENNNFHAYYTCTPPTHN